MTSNDIIAALKRAVADCPDRGRDIAHRADMDQAQLWESVNRRADIMLSTGIRIADAVGWEITLQRRKDT